MEVRVQELLEARATAAHPGMMEFDFECLEFIEQRVHSWGSFVRPNVNSTAETAA
jgi:hypothetical protein